MSYDKAREAVNRVLAGVCADLRQVSATEFWTAAEYMQVAEVPTVQEVGHALNRRDDDRHADTR